MVLFDQTRREKSGRHFHRIRRVKATIWAFRTWGIDIYHCRYNAFSDPLAFKRFLERLEEYVQDELHRLIDRKKKEVNRLVYLRIIIKDFVDLRQRLRRKFCDHRKPKFPYLFNGEEQALAEFPSRYDKRLWPTRKDYVNHKVCWMHQAHLDFLDHCTIHALRCLSAERGANAADLPPELACRTDVSVPLFTDNASGPLTPPVRERFKIDASVKELDFLSLLVAEELADSAKINKKSLARVLARMFSTKGAKAPSPSVLYKSFYERDEKTVDRVKEMVLAILERIRKE